MLVVAESSSHAHWTSMTLQTVAAGMQRRPALSRSTCLGYQTNPIYPRGIWHHCTGNLADTSPNHAGKLYAFSSFVVMMSKLHYIMKHFKSRCKA